MERHEPHTTGMPARAKEGSRRPKQEDTMTDVSSYDFGQMIFHAMRTGDLTIPIKIPRIRRTLDITDPTMMFQRRERIRRATAKAQHNNGQPIRYGRQHDKERHEKA
jgi:hypothetical protein